MVQDQIEQQFPTIAIIDDDDSYRNVLGTKFTLEKFKVFEARDGSEGLNVVRQHKPDLILLGIFLPDIDGFKVLETIKKDQDPAVKQIPVVIITKLHEDSGYQRCIDLGAVSYVVKAQRTPDQIVQLVKAILKNHKDDSDK